MEARRYPTSVLCRRLGRLAQPCWPHVCGVLLLSLLAAPIAVLTPLPLKVAVDSAVGTAPWPHWMEVLVPSSVPRSSAVAIWAATLLVLVIALVGRLQELSATMLQT